MINWKAKLTSRKFWMAIICLVSGLLLAFKVDAETVETISGVIMSAGSVIAYIIGEGLADAASAGNESPIVFNGTLDKLDDSKEAKVEILNKILDFAKEDSSTKDDGK